MEFLNQWNTGTISHSPFLPFFPDVYAPQIPVSMKPVDDDWTGIADAHMRKLLSAFRFIDGVSITIKLCLFQKYCCSFFEVFTKDFIDCLMFRK